MSIAVGIELGASRGRGATATAGGAQVAVDVAAAVALDDTGSVLVGDAASGAAGAVTGFVGELGRAEPYLVRGTPYGAEALTAQLLRQVFDRSVEHEPGAPVATALVHDDAWGEYELDLLREAVRLAAIGPVHLVAAAVARTYEADDLAVGAARWAWEQRDESTAAPVSGSPVSARTVLLGVGAGTALAVGGGAALAGSAGGAAAGSTLADFAGPDGGSTLGDFAGDAAGSTLSDFADPAAGRGSSLGDFADRGAPRGGHTGGDVATSVAKRGIAKLPAAIAAAVVTVGVVVGVALASSGGDDAPEQAAVTSTTEAEISTTTQVETSTTLAAGAIDDERLRTPFLFACGGSGLAGAGSGGPATAASCGRPLDVAVGDDGTVYFTDYRIRGAAISTVRAVLPDGTLRSFDFGEIENERIDSPSAVAVAADGTLYVADVDHHRILRRLPNGVVTRYAGLADGSAAGDVGSGRPILVGDNVPAKETAIGNVGSMALDDDGNLYFTDHHNDIVQRIDADGIIHTVADDLTSRLQGGPVAVELDERGRPHIAGTHSVWRLDGTTLVKVAASGERPAQDEDQTGRTALDAEFWIEDIAFAPDGTLYVAEIVERASVWRVPLDGGGTVERVRGGDSPSPTEGPTADRIAPTGIAVDDEGRILLSEAGSGFEMVRRFPAPS